MRAEKSRVTAENSFVGGGELGALLRDSFGDALRSHDWSQTPLGAVETWSDDLKAAVQILLTELDRAKPSEKTQRDAEEQKDGSASAALHQANQLNAFRVKLADALRPLTDASEIQAIAARILGESLGATRVIYIEVVSGGEEVIVHCNYTNGVAQLSGRYRLEDYRRNLTADHQVGRTQVVTDIPNNPKYTDAQKTRYREIDIAAHIDVPLIKNNQFVALLAAQQSTPRQWTETEVKLVEETAERTWAAVERAYAEAALRESEAKYRTLFESIDEGFCIVQMLFDENDTPVDYRFLEINPVFEQQTGLQQAVGKTARQLVPDLEDFWIETYGRVALTGEPVRFENRSAPMNRWFDVYACRTGQPEDRKVAIVFKDISDRKRVEDERKQVEAALRESEERFRELANDLPMLIWMADEQANVSYANKALLHFVGLEDYHEFTGKVWESVVHPDEVELIYEVYQTAVRDRQAYTLELRYRNAMTGTFEWHLVNGVPRYVNNQFAGMIGTGVNIHERKLAEAALRQSEQRFRLMADAVPQIVWITDTEGRVEFFNKQWSNYTGVLYEPTTAAEVAANFVHPEDGDRTIAAFNEARRTGGVFSVEHRIRSAAGTYRWFLVRAEPYRDSQTGEIIHWFGASIDIHDRKQVEDSLRQSEARFRRIFECEMVPMGIYTPAGGIVEANNSLLNLIGYTRQELETGQISWKALTPPEYRALDEIAVNEVATRGVSTPYEKVYLHKDGRKIPILIGAALLLEDNSSGVFFAIDLTDRKQAEAIITTDLENTRLLRDLSARLIAEDNIQVLYDEIVSAAITLTRADAGSIQALDESTQELVLIATQGIDRTVTDHFQRVTASSITSCGLVLATGKRTFVDFDVPESEDPDGSLRLHLNTGLICAQSTPLISRSGRRIGMVSTHWRKHHRPTEQELRFLDLLARQAADLIEQRQTEAERQQILEREQAAREEAERANRIKDEFLAVLSHELRSPLNPILGWTRLLQNRKLDEARRAEALKTIERNAKLQTQLIEDLLDISRIMQGKLSLTAAPVSLTFVISAAIETVRLAAEAKQIRLQLDLDNTVAPISGDAARLQQVVWNLLSNAVKFTPNGGQVTVELRQLNQLAQIRVIDTGKGINPQFLPYIPHSAGWW